VDREAFVAALTDVVPSLLRALAVLEHARRHLHPPAMARLRGSFEALDGELCAARARLGDDAPDGLEAFAAALRAACDHAIAALGGIAAQGDIARVLRAMHRHDRAQATLYGLRRALPPVGLFFLEPWARARAAELDPPVAAASTGLQRAGNAAGERGGFTLYVPESLREGERRPLVVALHGGGGHGDDFVWTWLREARSRRLLLLAPTSRASTWSLQRPQVDLRSLRRMLEWVDTHVGYDPARVLGTGLSDGATFTLLSGLARDSPFTALAPVAGVLHPANFANGNLERARARRIRLVHGALDWMFPVALARAAADALRDAGAELVYREIDDLSHTYPREENAAILDWWGAGRGE